MIKGNRNSWVNFNDDIKKVKIIIERCKPSNGTICASNDQIDEWIEGKSIMMGAIQKKSNLMHIQKPVIDTR